VSRYHYSAICQTVRQVVDESTKMHNGSTIHKLPNISPFSEHEDLHGFEKDSISGIFERKESVALEGLANIIE